MRVTVRHMGRGGLVAAVAVGLIGAGGVVVPVAASPLGITTAVPAVAGSARSARAGDVDGDGRSDVIAGVHLLKVNGKSDAGGVVVYLGGAKAVSGRARVVTAGDPVAKENLGRVLVSADFDRDGYADVLAAARKRLVLFRGSRAGLRGKPAQVIPWPVTEPAMAAADFDGDGYGDAAVAGDKRIVVLRGGRTGLRMAGLANGAPRFGAELAAGDVTGDGLADLVATERRPAPAEPVGPQRITVVPGSRAGLSLKNAWSISPAERAARALAVGDVNGDRRADLVRVTSTDPGNVVFQVIVQLSTGTGFGPARALAYGDGYPAGVALGDVTGDGRADLAVHVAGEGDHDWAVLHAGTSTGVTARPVRTYTHDTYETRYGTSLRLANVTGDARADLVVGLPGVYGAGALEVLPGGGRAGARKLTLRATTGLGWSQPS
ncbi:hypothetical protein Skr01_65290 [Sphaerisporangium krabiense]|uniref:VCBS repeat-containing protein n=1 Tax=Sphaerisporangium krabiense TaxID=763782 RepID=A0A7W8Z0E6_9ACTN|nr:VCBS repeat-containing protein [Sphaerisporangium krabiense]MBB5624855.1 hypothetical protein [Sphaerisporangium krabiense]GII66444.1 hypothetical protein Skr01_65290 [Sphaerisporangium krabiense]